MIIFVLILFFGINLSNGNETTSVDQLLQSNNVSCDIHKFVNSVDTPEEEYKQLTQDLTKYCSNPSSSNQVICHMVFIVFQTACQLPNNSHPAPTKYITNNEKNEFCSYVRIPRASEWVWQKLSTSEKEQIGSSSKDLCPKLAQNADTLRLVKFFYTLTLRIRRRDPLNKDEVIIPQTSSTTVTSINTTSPIVSQPETKKTSEIVNQTVENTTIGTTQTTSQTTAVTSQTTVGKNQTDVGKNQTDVEKDETKKIEGSPFGRAGDDRGIMRDIFNHLNLSFLERLQINERPKPKVLDVESVFKIDKNEERHWVEGKNDNNNLGSIRFEENPVLKPPINRKRNPFKLKFNRYVGGDDDKHDDEHTSNSFTTTVLVFALCAILIYLILHNKNKILGLIIEGCKRRRVANNRRTPLTRRTRLSQSTN